MKTTKSAKYLHRKLFESLPVRDRQRFADAMAKVKASGPRDYSYAIIANILKLHHGGDGVSFLFYPFFDRERNPRLCTSVLVKHGKVTVRDYSGWRHPPVLHKKSLFVK
jgi:hypothetical protein